MMPEVADVGLVEKVSAYLTRVVECWASKPVAAAQTAGHNNRIRQLQRTRQLMTRAGACFLNEKGVCKLRTTR